MRARALGTACARAPTQVTGSRTLFMGPSKAILSRVCVMLIEYMQAKKDAVGSASSGIHEFLWNIMSGVLGDARNRSVFLYRFRS